MEAFNGTPPEEKRPKRNSALVGLAALSAAYGASYDAQADTPQPEPIVEMVEAESEAEALEGAGTFIASLEEAGNHEAVAAYHAGIQELIASAETDAIEKAAVFIVHPDGSFEWNNLNVTEQNPDASRAVGGINVRIEDVSEYRNLANSGSHVIFIHTHPTNGFEIESHDDLKKVPPSPRDIMGIISEYQQIDPENFSNLQFQAVTEGVIWDFGFKDTEALDAFLEARSAPSEIYEQLDTPLLEEAAEEINRLKKHAPEYMRSYVDYFDLFFAGDPIESLKTNPDLGESLVKLLDLFFSVTNKKPSKEMSRFITILENAHVELLDAYQDIDPDTDGNFADPPFNGMQDDYVQRWNGIGVYMHQSKTN